MPIKNVVYRQREAGQVLTDLSDYRRAGGYEALRKALAEMDRDEAIYAFVRSGLRGRGGAGFPMGRKASFIPKDSVLPAYVVCNADESEPGTFKDRELMETNPFQLLEGITLAGYAIGAVRGYIYIRGEYEHQARVLDSAIAQARAAGFLGRGVAGSQFDFDITLYRGAGAYICGEETALLESLEGKRGQPRLKPPFPAVAGLYASPTLINNVETLATLPAIVEHGADWYAAMGTEKSTGTKLFSISGHVMRPGNYEIVLHDTTLRELIYDIAGGFRPGREFAAAWVGGSSVNVLGPEALDTPLDYESMAEAGSSLGSAGCIVMDDSGVDRARDAAPGPLLPARVVRQVHALPRGHPLAGAHPAADRRRRGSDGGPRADRVAGRADGGPRAVRPGRHRRAAGRQRGAALPRRLRPRHRERRGPPARAHDGGGRRWLITHPSI